MRTVIAVAVTAAALVLVQSALALAEDKCPDPWAKLQGAYKCEGPCNYTASVCDLPFYATGYKRWRFVNGQGGSATGILETEGAGIVSFATTSKWTFTTASTSDCGATIQFEGEPKGVTWRRIDDAPPACGGRRGKATR